MAFCAAMPHSVSPAPDRTFATLPISRALPPRSDLAGEGWRRLERPASGAVVLTDRWNAALCGVATDWPAFDRIIALDVDCGLARSHLLRLGFADAIPSGTSREELSLRAERLDAARAMVARRRVIGPLLLDLMHRDGRVGERWLRLYPREFALLWRLSDTPGVAVSRPELMREVWRLSVAPETNTLAVHVARLRAKLSALGLPEMVETTADGHYRLRAPCVTQPAQSGSEEREDARIGLRQ